MPACRSWKRSWRPPRRTQPGLELEAAAAAAAVQQLQSGLDQMQSQILLGMGQMTAASSRLASAQAGLTASQQALDQAFTAYDQQVEAARAAADLHTVVTAETLTALLSAQNLDMPAGFVYQRGVSTIVTVGDSISTIQELEALPLFDLGIQDLEPIVLSDVAEVTASDNARGDIRHPQRQRGAAADVLQAIQLRHGPGLR